MGRYSGNVGFVIEEEVKPGKWEAKAVERKYYGDILSNYRQLENNDVINDGVNINNKFSIIADPFAKTNFHSIRYIEYMGTLWRVKTVEVQYPRLILNIGGVYNGKRAITAG